MLSIIIPAYNESKRILPTLAAVKEFCHQHGKSKTEVIIVCDGCSDGTDDVVRKAISDHNAHFTLISYPDNRGKGHAVREGILASKGTVVGFMDADGSTPVTELNTFLKLFAAERNLDAIIGSRRTTGAVLSPPQPWHRRQMGHTLSWITRTFLDIPYKDTQCGFKFFRGELARNYFLEITSNDFSFDIELLHLLHSRGHLIGEVGVHWHNDDRSTVSPLKDTFRMLQTVMKIRTRYRSRKWSTDSLISPATSNEGVLREYL